MKKWNTNMFYLGRSDDLKYSAEFTVVPPPVSMGGRQTVPFEVTISAADTSAHELELYASRSNSIPYEGKEGKWVHLVPTWRFEDLSGNVITKITTTDTLVSATNHIDTLTLTFSGYFDDDYRIKVSDSTTEYVLRDGTRNVGWYSSGNASAFTFPGEEANAYPDTHGVWNVVMSGLNLPVNCVIDVDMFDGWKTNYQYCPWNMAFRCTNGETASYTNMTSSSGTSLSINPAAVSGSYVFPNGPWFNTYVKTGSIDTSVFEFNPILSGVSGVAKFYYVDDMPTSYRRPAVLWATMSMSGIPLLGESDEETIAVPAQMNSKVVAVAPYEINALMPTELGFTRDGVTPMSAGIYWKNQEIPCVATIRGSMFDDFLTDDQRLNTGPRIVYNCPYDTSAAVTLSAVTVDVSGGALPYIALESTRDTSAYPVFRRFDTSGNNFRIGGYTRGKGTFSEAGADSVISGSMLMSGFQNFATSFCWIAAPDDNKIIQLTYPYVNEDYTSGVSGWLGRDSTEWWDYKWSSAGTEPLLQKLNYYSLTGFGGIYAMAVDPAYSVWMADGELARLYKYDWTGMRICSADLTEQLSVFLADTPVSSEFISGDATPNNVSIAADNTVYVSYFDSYLVTRHDGTNGNMIGAVVFDGTTAVSGVYNEPFGKPVVVEPAPDGNVWFVYARDSYCVAEKRDSSMLTVLDTVTLPDRSYPFDVFCDATGDLYMTLSFHVEHDTPDPGMLAVVRRGASAHEVLVGGIFEPSYMTVDKDRNIWFASDDNRINVWHIGTSTRSWFDCGSAASTMQPYTSAYADVKQSYAIEGISCDSNNRMWIINSPERKLYFYDVDTMLSGYGGSGVIYADPIMAQTFECSSYTSVFGVSGIRHETILSSYVVTSTEMPTTVDMSFDIPVTKVVDYTAYSYKPSDYNLTAARMYSEFPTTNYTTTRYAQDPTWAPTAVYNSSQNIPVGDFDHAGAASDYIYIDKTASNFTPGEYYNFGMVSGYIDRFAGTWFVDTTKSTWGEKIQDADAVHWFIGGQSEKMNPDIWGRKSGSASYEHVNVSLSRLYSRDISVYRIELDDVKKSDPNPTVRMLFRKGATIVSAYDNARYYDYVDEVSGSTIQYVPLCPTFDINLSGSYFASDPRALEQLYIDRTGNDCTLGPRGFWPGYQCLIAGSDSGVASKTYTLALNPNGTGTSVDHKFITNFIWRPWKVLEEDSIDWHHHQNITSSTFSSNEYGNTISGDWAYAFLSEDTGLTTLTVPSSVPSTYTQVTTTLVTAISAWYEYFEPKQYSIQYANLTNLWARGDWSGCRFFSKYGLLSGILSGVSDTFAVNDYEDFRIRRFNESWDTEKHMKSYTTSEFQENSAFFNDYVGGLVGGVENGTHSIGRILYEKIANQVPNLHDVDECGIGALNSISRETDVPIDDYLLPYPEAVQRIMDIASVSHGKLWGDRCTCNENFLRGKSAGYCDRCHHYHRTNLGPVVGGSYTVSANVPYIIENKFRTRDYRVIRPSTKSCSAASGVEVSGVMTASLSAHTSLFVPAPSGDQEWLNYCYYEYIPTRCDTQNTGVVHWDDPYTTLDESVSGSESWYGDSGILEKLFGYLLHNGYGYGLSGYEY